MRRPLVAALVLTLLTGCLPERDPVVSTQLVKLRITGKKLSKHTWVSFQSVDGLTRYSKQRTGKYCSGGRKWQIGDVVLLREVTYRGKAGLYRRLDSGEARRLCKTS